MLEEVLKKNNKVIKNIEADLNSTWVVLDCEDFVVNVFYEPTRKFYNLEGIPQMLPSLWFKTQHMLKEVLKNCLFKLNNFMFHACNGIF